MSVDVSIFLPPVTGGLARKAILHRYYARLTVSNSPFDPIRHIR